MQEKSQNMSSEEWAALYKTDKDAFGLALAQALCDGLNSGVSKDHINYVENGIRELDDDYFTALKDRNLQGADQGALPYSELLEKAVRTADRVHKGQTRKGQGRKLPYTTHLFAVANILARYGEDQNTIIAGLLHDSIEDGKDEEGTPYSEASLREEFGSEIADIVMGVTEDMELKLNPDKSGTWRERKNLYLKHLKDSANKAALVISCADKIHNLGCILEGCSEQKTASCFWAEFNATPKDIIWYNKSVLEIVKERLDHCIVDELESLISQLEVVCAPHNVKGEDQFPDAEPSLPAFTVNDATDPPTGNVYLRIRRRLISEIVAKSIHELEGMDRAFMKSSENFGLANLWEEICIQARDGEYFGWEDVIKARKKNLMDVLMVNVIEPILTRHVNDLSSSDRLAFWLYTDPGIEWEHNIEKGFVENDAPPVCADDIVVELKSSLLESARYFENPRIEQYLDMIEDEKIYDIENEEESCASIGEIPEKSTPSK